MSRRDSSAPAADSAAPVAKACQTMRAQSSGAGGGVRAAGSHGFAHLVVFCTRWANLRNATGLISHIQRALTLLRGSGVRENDSASNVLTLLLCGTETSTGCTGAPCIERVPPLSPASQSCCISTTASRISMAAHNGAEHSHTSTPRHRRHSYSRRLGPSQGRRCALPGPSATATTLTWTPASYDNRRSPR